MIQAILAVVLMGVGVGFITLAGIGVARLPDAFQRMHASTKAGGIGCSLVVLGVLVSGRTTSLTTGVVTVVFMLLTLSVASQLLARASYVSGAPIQGLERGDPLSDVLPRAERPLEERAAPPRAGSAP